MRLRAGDQDHGVAGHPHAVDEDDAARLVNDLGHRPDRPEGGRPPPERASLTRHVALGFLRQQPADELPQPGRLVVVADRPRRAAVPAAPSLGSTFVAFVKHSLRNSTLPPALCVPLFTSFTPKPPVPILSSCRHKRHAPPGRQTLAPPPHPVR